MIATSLRTFSPIATHRQTRRNVVVQKRVVLTRSDLVEGSRILGEGITAGVIFYTTLQWAHYRRLRIEAEKLQQKEEEKNKKDKKD
jgi:hypothetical protein